MNDSLDKHQDRYRSLLIYLGQLQYNIVNTRETLDKLENERVQVIDELRQLDSILQTSDQDANTSPVESDI